MPFEEKCKALTALCDESAANLDGQIKAFDERRRTEKLDAIRAFFDERIGELAEFLPWEAVLDKRWGNATYSEEQAHKDILVAISKCDSSIAAIRGLNSEFETTLLEEYKQCHDLPTVLKKDQALKRVKEIEERRKAEQEQRRQQAEAARAAEDSPFTTARNARSSGETFSGASITIRRCASPTKTPMCRRCTRSIWASRCPSARTTCCTPILTRGRCRRNRNSYRIRK